MKVNITHHMVHIAAVQKELGQAAFIESFEDLIAIAPHLQSHQFSTGDHAGSYFYIAEIERFVKVA